MRRRSPRAPSLVLAGLAVWAALATGCDGRTELEVLAPDAGSDAATVVEDAGPPPIETATTVDLLLVVDNSPNTENFQGLLAATVPYLVGRFAQPACVNGLGNVVATTPNVTDPCPDGQREFQPVEDVHIGVISSSLGGHGADSCSPASPFWNVTQDDAGHLITRGPAGTVVPTYQSLGFLAWDPSQQDVPPGEGDIGALGDDLANLISNAGTQGCGFEATLESMYRFLVDPEPYLTLPVIGGQAMPTGTDTTVLQQRADFLRPTSALVVLIITDEDDCSTIESGENYYSLQALVPGDPNQIFHLPPPRSECAVNPDDPCCASCGQATPAGCPTDPACAVPTLSEDGGPHQPALLRPEASLRHRLPLPRAALRRRPHQPHRPPARRHHGAEPALHRQPLPRAGDGDRHRRRALARRRQGPEVARHRLPARGRDRLEPHRRRSRQGHAPHRPADDQVDHPPDRHQPAHGRRPGAPASPASSPTPSTATSAPSPRATTCNTPASTRAPRP